MRLVIAMMKHETNTFSPIITDWARFQAWGAYQGDEVAATFSHTRMPIAAYMKLARERNAEIITPLAAEAMPSGPVTRDAYERMASLICEAVKGGCDGVLLDLHGAMVAQHTFDGEGTLLERLRSVTPALPIAVTCDLHCNLTAAMVDNCTALIGYKTYPHTDMYEVAEQVGKIVLDSIASRIKPVMAWGRSQVLSQTLCQGTDDEPMRGLIASCVQAETSDKILAATVFGGFALADTPDAGSSAIVVADGDLRAAEAIRDPLLDALWQHRESFVYQHHSLDAAIARAAEAESGPVILLDHADNCGSGGTQDVMSVIAAVHESALNDVIVAAVWDPWAVRTMQNTGVGHDVELDLGGRTDMPSIGERGRPLKIRGRVKALSDGQWTVQGPMYTGLAVDMGASAVLDTGAMQIVVVSRHHEPWDLGVFTSLGIAPERHKYILLKSRIHYRAGFGSLPKQTFTLDGDGVTTSDTSRLAYEHIRRPMYPLDKINES